MRTLFLSVAWTAAHLDVAGRCASKHGIFCPHFTSPFHFTNVSSVFEQRVIQAIQSGDLQELKRCCISKSDVNRCISLSKEVPVISASKQCPFPTIRAPTPLVYSILCEQPELALEGVDKATRYLST